MLWLNQKLMGGSESFLIDFSYLMGVMVGDGFAWIKSGGRQHYGIGLRVTDKPFAISFKKVLKRLGFNTYLGTTHTQSGTKLYQVRTSGNGYRGSKEIALWFKKLSLNQIKSIVRDNRDRKIAFIRGFYESEGCLSYRYKKKNKRPSGYRVRMGCTNKKMVFYVSYLLNSLGYKANISCEQKGYSHRIYIQAIAQVERFFKEINPSIKRTVKLPRTQKQKDRIKLYERALDLHSKGFTNTEIMYKIGVPDNTLHYWIKGVTKPRSLSRSEVIVL